MMCETQGYREPRNRDRRLACVLVVPETFVFLTVGAFSVEGTRLPEDARVVGVSFDGHVAAFRVFVESAEFEPVAEGEPVPVIDGPHWQTVRWEGS